jgi:hypothetical protein
MTIGEIIFTFVASIVALFMIYLMFVFVPTALYTEAECLRTGYPKAYVTVGLERYCSTLDGAVTVKIKKQSD